MFIDLIKLNRKTILRVYDFFNHYGMQNHGKGLWFQGDYWTYTGLSKVETLNSRNVDNEFLQKAIRLLFEQEDIRELIDKYNKFRRN